LSRPPSPPSPSLFPYTTLFRSVALQADALDFLGDATTYGISLAAIGTSIQIRARAAILKAFSLSAMALWVLGSTAYHVLILGIRSEEHTSELQSPYDLVCRLLL